MKCLLVIRPTAQRKYTSKHYGGMWGTLLNALKSKLLRYINGLDWIEIDANGEVEIEDVLSQFLEDHKNER